MSSSNIAALRQPSNSQREIDVRDEQQALLDAESACMTALEKCAKATAGFASFILKTESSILHPRVRKLHSRVSEIMGYALNLPAALSDGHKIAHGIAKAKSDAIVVMTGGIPKEEKGKEGEKDPDLLPSQ